MDPSNGPVFEVYGKNVPWTGNPARSVTEYVEVKYCGQVIRLGPGLTATLIDVRYPLKRLKITISTMGTKRFLMFEK